MWWCGVLRGRGKGGGRTRRSRPPGPGQGGAGRGGGGTFDTAVVGCVWVGVHGLGRDVEQSELVLGGENVARPRNITGLEVLERPWSFLLRTHNTPTLHPPLPTHHAPPHHTGAGYCIVPPAPSSPPAAMWQVSYQTVAACPLIGRGGMMILCVRSCTHPPPPTREHRHPHHRRHPHHHPLLLRRRLLPPPLPQAAPPPLGAVPPPPRVSSSTPQKPSSASSSNGGASADKHAKRKRDSSSSKPGGAGSTPDAGGKKPGSAGGGRPSSSGSGGASVNIAKWREAIRSEFVVDMQFQAPLPDVPLGPRFLKMDSLANLGNLVRPHPPIHSFLASTTHPPTYSFIHSPPIYPAKKKITLPLPTKSKPKPTHLPQNHTQTNTTGGLPRHPSPGH